MKDIFIYSGYLRYCKFSNIKLFDLLRERFPDTFQELHGCYTVHKVFKKLNILIEERQLFDPNNTEILVFDEKHRDVFRIDAIFYIYFQEIVSPMLLTPEYMNDRSNIRKRVKATWHRTDSIICRATYDRDYDAMNLNSECKVEITECLQELIKSVKPLDESVKTIKISTVTDCAADYILVNKFSLYREWNSLIFVEKDPLLKELTGASIAVSANQLLKVIIANCFIPNHERCITCGRNPVFISYDEPYVDSSDSDSYER